MSPPKTRCRLPISKTEGRCAREKFDYCGISASDAGASLEPFPKVSYMKVMITAITDIFHPIPLFPDFHDPKRVREYSVMY